MFFLYKKRKGVDAEIAPRTKQYYILYCIVVSLHFEQNKRILIIHTKYIIFISPSYVLLMFVDRDNIFAPILECEKDEGFFPT